MHDRDVMLILACRTAAPHNALRSADSYYLVVDGMNVEVSEARVDSLRPRKKKKKTAKKAKR